MDPKRLEEIASFNLAKYVWSVYVHTKISAKQLLPLDIIPSNVLKRILDIGSLLSKLFPLLPKLCEQTVIASITVIGKFNFIYS